MVKFSSTMKSLAVISLAWVAGSALSALPVQSVPYVDMNRYAGTWFELARLPNRFQDQCVADVTADYSPNKDGSVAVVNRCRTATGEVEKTEGRAVAADKGESNARLKVSFLPRWLQWFPLGKGDYWVVMLDADYRYAVVSEPSREYVWILSRSPSMDPIKYHGLLERLRAAGYPVERLVKTQQGGAMGSAAMVKVAHQVR